MPQRAVKALGEIALRVEDLVRYLEPRRAGHFDIVRGVAVKRPMRRKDSLKIKALRRLRPE